MVALTLSADASYSFMDFLSSEGGNLFLLVIILLSINIVAFATTVRDDRVFGVLDLYVSEEMQKGRRGNYELVNVN